MELNRRHRSFVLLVISVLVSLLLTAVLASSGAAKFSSAVLAEPAIDVWYGSDQKFGNIGNPQQWVNIVGNVAGLENAGTLKYALNGKPDQDLSIGPDDGRLEANGDFNIEIAYADLNPSNTVLIKASDGVSETQQVVTVNYTAGTTWPSDYTAVWNSSADIQDIAQVVDGDWRLDGSSVVIDSDTWGFDRLLAIGDETWTDYEVTVPITVNGLYPAGNQKFGSGVGFILRWQGHENVAGEQPNMDWSRSGALGWYHWTSSATEALEIRNNENETIGVNYNQVMDFGTTYMFKMSVQSLAGAPAYYRLKFWEQGTPEPLDWAIQGSTSDTAAEAGSLLLVAHNVDARFGEVTVTDLEKLRLNVDVTVDGEGTYLLDPDQEDFTYSERVLVYALPEFGYDFAGWTGDYVGAENPANFLIYKDMNLTAHFTDCSGSIAIEKQTVPATGDRFKFVGDLGRFFLHNDESKVFDGLCTGDHVIREINSPAWTADEIDCGDANITNQFDGVTVHLDPGQDVTCTFTNRRQPPLAENVEFISRIGGATYAAAVAGDYAYIGEGANLAILDISDRSAPSVTAKLTAVPGVVNDVTVDGDYAYVAGSGRYYETGALSIFDITVPDAPVQLSTYEVNDNFLAVDVQGEFAYVATNFGLRIVNISDRAAPVEVGFYEECSRCTDVVVAGELAYMTVANQGLFIVDISHPRAPIKLAVFDTPGMELGVDIAGTTAYVAAANSGLYAVDITNPQSPVEIGVHNTPGSAHDVAAAGDIAYVADYNRGLSIIDIGDPSTPSEIEVVETPGLAYHVAVDAGFAYVADGAGLHIVDIASDTERSTTAAAAVGRYDSPGIAFDVEVAEPYAYVLAEHSGLHIIDISDPANPVEVGAFNTVGSPGGLAVAGNFAYVGAGDSGLRIVNISDPANPVEAGFYDTPGYAAGVAVSTAGNLAYVADGPDGMLRIIKVLDPAVPFEKGFFATAGYAYHVAVAGEHAYVTNIYDGVAIVDVAGPLDPVAAGLFDAPGQESDVAVAGDYAYITAENSGLYIVDVSNPSAAVEVGFFEMSIDPWAVAVAGNYVHLAEGWEYGGLRVVKAADLSNPVEAGYYTTAGYAENLAVAGQYTYIADRHGGLIILRYSGPGSITVAKETDAADSTPFAFNGDLGVFSLANGESKLFADLEEGSYAISEENALGWRLDGVDCDGRHVTADEDGVTILLAPGEDVTCTFGNNRLAAAAGAGGPYSGDEGEAIALDGSSSSNQAIIKAYWWDCTGDGSWDVLTATPTGSSCTYPDNGTYTVKLGTVDIFDRIVSDWAQVTVENVAPEVDAGDDQKATAGEELQFSGSYFDPGTADTHLIEWDMGDGHKTWGTLSPKHIYSGRGQYIVTLTVTDDDGESDSDSLIVNVDNCPPELGNIVVSPQEINEGDTFILSGTMADTSSNTAFTLEIDWGDGISTTKQFGANSTSFSFSHFCADDDPSGTTADFSTIYLTLTDSDGDIAEGTAAIKVHNVAPAVDAGPDRTAFAGQPLNFTAAVTDPGAPDTHTVTWDFGDGSPPLMAVDAVHTFSAPGAYTVTVTVEDDDGGAGQDTIEVAVQFHSYLPMAIKP